MKNYIIIICLFTFFLADSLSGTLLPESTQATCEQLNSSDAVYADAAQRWQVSMIAYGTQKAWAMCLFPVLLIVVAIARPKPDIFDFMFAAIVLLSSVITISDWYLNTNTRSTTIDWLVTILLLLFIIIIKIANYGLHRFNR